VAVDSVAKARAAIALQANLREKEVSIRNLDV
jgi:hypothetical protein